MFTDNFTKLVEIVEIDNLINKHQAKFILSICIYNYCENFLKKHTFLILISRIDNNQTYEKLTLKTKVVRNCCNQSLVNLLALSRSPVHSKNHRFESALIQLLVFVYFFKPPPIGMPAKLASCRISDK